MTNIYIDKDTATWGMQENLVAINLNKVVALDNNPDLVDVDSIIDFLLDASDTDIIAFAKQCEVI